MEIDEIGNSVTAKKVEEYNPDYKRSVQVIIYDLQGGPFPENAFREIDAVASKLAEAYPSLAITVVRE